MYFEDLQRVTLAMEQPHAIFVFGSNLRGVHGAGAAEVARKRYGAKLGVGYGLTGRAFAIPTKDKELQPLPLAVISHYVTGFCDFARSHQEHLFVVTRVGCGLAGYTDEQIAPLFALAPANCSLAQSWRLLLRR